MFSLGLISQVREQFITWDPPPWCYIYSRYNIILPLFYFNRTRQCLKFIKKKFRSGTRKVSAPYNWKKKEQLNHLDAVIKTVIHVPARKCLSLNMRHPAVYCDIMIFFIEKWFWLNGTKNKGNDNEEYRKIVFWLSWLRHFI